MRGFLGFAFVLVAALVVAALVVVPMVARPIVVDAVRAALPFEGQPLDVEVELNPVGLLLGSVDSIHVTGHDLEARGASIGDLDVTVTDVSTSDHRFRSATGVLRDIELPDVAATPIKISSVTLDGPYGDVQATARLDVQGSLALVGNAFADAGLPVDGLELTEGGVAFSILGQQIEVPLAIDHGALVLPDVAGLGPMVILQPGSDDPWRITAVRAAPGGFELDVSLQPDGVLAPS